MNNHIKDFFPFDKMRDGQENVMNEIEKAFKYNNFVIVQAPTGVGKSPISMASIGYNTNGHILTDQITLQNQYVRDFDIKKVSGRGNFDCISDPDEKCNTGLCISDMNYKCPYKPSAKNKGALAAISHTRGDLYWSDEVTFKCPYWEQKCIAINNPSVIHNYSYSLYEFNYTQDFGLRNILICDEGHNIEKHLLSFNDAVISRREMEDIQQKYNAFGTDVRKWLMSLNHLTKNLFPERLKSISSQLKRKDLSKNKQRELINKKERLENLLTKLNFITFSASKNPEDWVITIEYDKEKKGLIDKVKFNPLVIDKYADAQLFQYGKNVLIMSATIMNPQVVADNLGIENYRFINIPQSFDPSQKPIYHLNIANLNADAWKVDNVNNKIQEVVDAIDIILDVFNEKGIIHTTTFAIAKLIKERSRHSHRILTHTPETRQKVIDKHINSPEKTILCSPSMTEGLDLFDNLSRIQILVKVPYPNMGDPVIRAKKERDEKNGVPYIDSWYNWKTTIDIAQAYGRSIRSPNDFALTFTIDDRFEPFCKRNQIRKYKNENGAFVREKTLFAEAFNDFVRPTEELFEFYGAEFEKAIMKNGRNTSWATKYL